MIDEKMNHDQREPMENTNGHRPGPPRQRVTPLNLVGTAEAAHILGVEKPRIGRWINRGVMPPPVAWLAATLVWRREDIEAMRDWVKAIGGIESMRRRLGMSGEIRSGSIGAVR